MSKRQSSIVKIICLGLTLAMVTQTTVFAADVHSDTHASAVGCDDSVIVQTVDEPLTVEDVFSSFDVDVKSSNTSIYLVEGAESPVRGSETDDSTHLVAVTDNGNGTMDVLSIGAAIEDNDKVAMTDIEVESDTSFGLRSTPIGYVNGSLLDYTSQLGSAYDYYFALGATYSYITRSGYYAFRPTSTYCYVRKSSTATKTVSSMTLGFGLSGLVITSTTSSIGDDTIFPLSSSEFPKVFSYPTSGTQYSVSLTSLWAEDGYATNEYLWCYYAGHAFGLSLIVSFSDGKYVYVEHAIVEERI